VTYNPDFKVTMLFNVNGPIKSCIMVYRTAPFSMTLSDFKVTG